MVPLVDEKGVDTCPCGTQLRLRFDASWPREPEGVDVGAIIEDAADGHDSG